MNDIPTTPPPAPQAPAPPPPSGSGKNTVIIVLAIVGGVGLLGCVCLAAILVPALGRAREIAHRTVDGTNGRNIVTGMMIYANENNGEFPTHVGLMIADSTVAPVTFVNPSSDTIVPTYTGEQPADKCYTFGDFHFVYEGLGGGGPEENVRGDDILMFGRGFNGEGRNVVFGDSHVEFVDEVRFTELIREANAHRANLGLTPIDPNALGDYQP